MKNTPPRTYRCVADSSPVSQQQHATDTLAALGSYRVAFELDRVPDLVQGLVADLVANLLPDLVRDLLIDLVTDLVQDLVRDLVTNLVLHLVPSQQANLVLQLMAHDCIATCACFACCIPCHPCDFAQVPTWESPQEIHRAESPQDRGSTED